MFDFQGKFLGEDCSLLFYQLQLCRVFLFTNQETHLFVLLCGWRTDSEQLQRPVSQACMVGSQGPGRPFPQAERSTSGKKCLLSSEQLRAPGKQQLISTCNRMERRRTSFPLALQEERDSVTIHIHLNTLADLPSARSKL